MTIFTIRLNTDYKDKKKMIIFALMKRFLLIAGLAAASLALSAQTKDWAVVELSSNLMREEPGYEAENGDQALMGTVVRVKDHKSYWTQIVSPEPYTAWANEMGLVEMTEEEKDAYIDAPKFICIAEYTHIFSEPSSKSDRVCDFIMGDLVRKGDGLKHGFQSVVLPSGKKGWVRAREVQDFGKWLDSRELTGESIVNMAKKFIGVPYLWGGTSIKHVDCSGLARSVYFMHGILLPRNASQQAKVGEEIKLEDAVPGDLIFFGRSATEDKPERVSHVSVYIGNGEIIHSSQMVRRNSIVPGTDNYYGGNILHVRRILTHVDDGTGIVSMKRSPFYFKQ